MSNLRITHGEVVTPEETTKSDLYINDNRLSFTSIADEKAYTTIINATDCYITPGLFDLQVNGNHDCNIWSQPGTSDFAKLCTSMLRAGVTAFLPTLITDDLERLHSNVRLLESYGVGKKLSSNLNVLINEQLGNEGNDQWSDLVYLPGIHLEGPFLSPQKPGVHPPQYILSLGMDDFKGLIRPSVKLMTIAPEIQRGLEAVQYLLEQNVIASLGHSNATYEEATNAFASGVRVVTHLFNALPPIHQRRPGAAVAALLNKGIYCCVICDGLHVDRHMVQLLLHMKEKDRVILVTDIASIGTAGGGLVGSSITLGQAVRNLVNWKLATFQDAIRMATLNPARAMGLDECIGQIKEGCRADLVVWNKSTLAIEHVIANGNKIF